MMYRVKIYGRTKKILSAVICRENLQEAETYAAALCRRISGERWSVNRSN